MKIKEPVYKPCFTVLVQAWIVLTALAFIPVARAAPVWGAQAYVSTSTCGGEVYSASPINILGSESLDVERTSTQYACGGMYGYAGDLPYAYARATASLSTGTLGVYSEVVGLGTQLTWTGNIITAPVAQAGFGATLTDVLSFVVPAHTPGTITFTTTVDGSYTPAVGAMHFAMGGDVNCTSDSCWGMLTGNWDADSWTIDNGGSPTTFYTRTIDIADSDFAITFDYLFGISLDGSARPFAGDYYGLPNVVSGTVDYIHTAALGYTLPDGVTLSSASNMLLTAPVPVPAATWLFVSGLLGLTGFACRNK